MFQFVVLRTTPAYMHFIVEYKSYIYVLVCERGIQWPSYNGNKPVEKDFLLPSSGHTFSIDIHPLSIRT